MGDAVSLEDPDPSSAKPARVGDQTPHEDPVSPQQILHAARIEARHAVVCVDCVFYLTNLASSADHALALQERRDSGLIEARALDGKGGLDGTDAVPPPEMHLGRGAGQPLDASHQPSDLGARGEKGGRECERGAVDTGAGHRGIVSYDTIHAATRDQRLPARNIRL
jgi:hypothetical protein